MIHELKTAKHWFDRIATDEQRVLIQKHDRDFQTGDLLHLLRSNDYGNRTSTFVERKPNGQFLNEYVQDEPITVRVTHVLPGTRLNTLDDGYCLLSVEVQS